MRIQAHARTHVLILLVALLAVLLVAAGADARVRRPGRPHARSATHHHSVRRACRSTHRHRCPRVVARHLAAHRTATAPARSTPVTTTATATRTAAGKGPSNGSHPSAPAPASTSTSQAAPAPTTPTTSTSGLAATLGSGPFVPFAPGGPWTTPVPATAPLDPQSSAIAANLAAQVQTYYGHAALNTSSYSAPIYTVGPGQATVNMAFNNCQGKPSLPAGFAAVLQNVPVPAGAVPSQGSDGEIVIYQPSTNTEWEFWKMGQNATTGVWSACWGGKITDVAQDPGIFPAGYGATASGLPLLGFLIRVGELQAGAITHALNLELPHVRASSFSWPANRTDGGDANATDPAAGERLRLDPALNLATLHLPAGELMIARALQTYGAIVTDQSGAVSIQGEDPRPYETGGASDPYTAYFPGPQYGWLQGIPWSRMQVVAWNYGKPAS